MTHTLLFEPAGRDGVLVLLRPGLRRQAGGVQLVGQRWVTVALGVLVPPARHPVPQHAQHAHSRIRTNESRGCNTDR